MMQQALSTAQTNGTELPFDSRTKFTYFTYSVTKKIYINQYATFGGILPHLKCTCTLWGLVTDNYI